MASRVDIPSKKKKKVTPYSTSSKKKPSITDISDDLDYLEQDPFDNDTLLTERYTEPDKGKKEKVVNKEFIPLINVSFDDDKKKKSNIHLDNFNEEMVPYESIDEGNYCFLCMYYSFSKDAPAGCVKVMLKSMEEMFAQAGSSIESIADQVSKYYEEQIYNPCLENGKRVPKLPKEMIIEHFYKHICHNPEVHIFTSFTLFKKLQYKLLNSACYYKLDSEGNRVDNNECFEIKNIEISLKLQVMMDKMLSKDPSKQAFGKERSFDISKKGNYLNCGEDIPTEYTNKFNQY